MSSNFRRSSLNYPIEDNQNPDQVNCEDILVSPEYQQKVGHLARKYTKGTTLSWEDAAQTAFIKVFQAVKAEKFRYGGVEEFQHWAMTVARFEIIDLVRREKKQYWQSLNQAIAGTELRLIDTLSDNFDLFEAVERTDLIAQVRETIVQLDQQYPNRHYLTLWHSRIQGKNQTQVSEALGLSQSAISKRWKELIDRLAQSLGLLQNFETLQGASNIVPDKKQLRNRSQDHW